MWIVRPLEIVDKNGERIGRWRLTAKSDEGGGGPYGDESHSHSSPNEAINCNLCQTFCSEVTGFPIEEENETGIKEISFNRLSPAELERLGILSEEIGEAQQIIGKIIRHGYESTHPDNTITNRSLLEIELGHVLNIIEMMEDSFDINHDNIESHQWEKYTKIKKYLHHQA